MKIFSILILIIFSALSLSAQQIVYPTYTVTGNETWDLNTYPDGILIQQHLTIEDGGFLTISTDVIVEFSQLAKVFVKIGGKLFLNGSTLKSNTNYAWGGIIVRGNPNYNFNDFHNQGLIVMDNNAKIEGAHAAVWFDDGSQTKTGGGTGVLKNSVFKNCNKSIVIGQSPKGRIAISNCNFIADDDYLDYYFLFPDGWKNDTWVPLGIQAYKTVAFINNSNFNCQMTNNQSGWAAITAAGGEVRVRNTEFNRWTLGIIGSSYDPTDLLIVRDNDFFECYKDALIFTGQTNSIVLRNDFEIGSHNSALGGFIIESSNFIIEENVFINNNNQSGRNGIWFLNTPPYIHNVYKNTFVGLFSAIRSLQTQRTVNDDGLVYKCNLFAGNRHDIMDWGPPGFGLAKYQGSFEDEPDAPAGNQFSWMGMSNSDIYNAGEHFFYIYHHQSNLNHQPVDYTHSTVTAQSNQGPNAGYDEELSCPSNFAAPGGGISLPIDTIIHRLEYSRTKISEIDDLISQLKDGGDSEGLKSEVQSSQPPQSYDLYLDLLETSPYLSNEVIEEAMNKESVISNTMLRDIMVANAHSAKDDDLLENLDYRATPMPDYMKAEIWQGKGFISALEVLKSRRSYYAQEEGRYYNLLKYHYMSDTIDESSNRNSLISLLENAGRIDAMYHLAFLYLNQEDYALAEDVLDDIPIVFVLNAKEYEEYLAILDYYGIRKEMQMNGQSLGAANSQQLDALLDLADNAYGLARSYACNVLSLYGLCEFELPDDMELKSLIDIDAEYKRMKKLLSSHQSLIIAPNPARTYIAVNYSISDLLVNAHIQILTPEGRTIKEIALNKIIDQKIIDVGDLQPGIYLLSIRNNGKVVETGKLIISY